MYINYKTQKWKKDIYIELKLTIFVFFFFKDNLLQPILESNLLSCWNYLNFTLKNYVSTFGINFFLILRVKMRNCITELQNSVTVMKSVIEGRISVIRCLIQIQWLFLLPVDPRIELSASAQALFLPACQHASCHDNKKVNFWNCKPTPVNFFLYYSCHGHGISIEKFKPQQKQVVY